MRIVIRTLFNDSVVRKLQDIDKHNHTKRTTVQFNSLQLLGITMVYIQGLLFILSGPIHALHAYALFDLCFNSISLL